MKRGESGLSLVVGIDKPANMTSHDVVNECRRIFEEKRVGHMGTLDPLATGVLPLCIGPATRLDAYLTQHDKHYRVKMKFGAETDTDDIQGIVTRTAPVYDDLLDGAFAEPYISGLVGKHMQVPPAYSAIKKDGVKAYESARKGKKVELEARPIEIFSSNLVQREWNSVDDSILWTLDLHVSKGTYIRSLVRDIGRELGSYAHVVELTRTKMGSLSLDDCLSLDALKEVGIQAALDPLRLLGIRFAFADNHAPLVSNGNMIRASELDLFELNDTISAVRARCCTPACYASSLPPIDHELVGIVIENKLKALYEYDESSAAYRSKCVFAQPIMRTCYQ